MKRAERDEWVAALRSGDYKQGKSRLNAGGRQCCLGVKCELDLAAGRYNIGRILIDEEIYSYNDLIGYPASSIMLGWGMSHTTAGQLAQLNDTGSTFEEIADWIEENVEVEE